jgi:hypothetical protein
MRPLINRRGHGHHSAAAVIALIFLFYSRLMIITPRRRG